MTALCVVVRYSQRFNPIVLVLSHLCGIRFSIWNDLPPGAQAGRARAYPFQHSVVDQSHHLEHRIPDSWVKGPMAACGEWSLSLVLTDVIVVVVEEGWRRRSGSIVRGGDDGGGDREKGRGGASKP